MADVEAVIEQRRLQLSTAPFLQSLERSSSIDDVRRFVPQLYFYVFAFQDVLRLTAETIADPSLRAIAVTHRDEDAGHEHWFAHDVEALDCRRDVAWVFGREHQATRDIAYGLVTEVLRPDDDRVRLVVPLCLEAAGSLFFGRVIGLLDRAGFDKPLRYFARHHQQVEADHRIFTDGTTSGELHAIAFDEHAFPRALASVHRCFDLLTRFAAQLEHHRGGA
jgi:hypothetical protein